MSKHNSCWGIEVGADAIKAVHLVRSGAEVVLADYEVLPFKKVLTTPDLNADEAIQVGLDQLITRVELSHSTVMASVPGHMAFARFAKLPPVDPKRIPDMVKFEAVQQIPFPIEQVEWDYQVFTHADSPDAEVGIFAITKERVINFLSNYRSVGITLDGLTLSPLAVYNALAYDEQMNANTPGTIIMDVGASSTDVIIVEQGSLWLRTLPIGGNQFTEALIRSFKLSFPKAEKLKREAGTSKYARQIFQAMRPVFADLLQEMQRSLGYYQSLNRDAKLTRLIGLGSTFRLPGLQKFLKQQLQLEVIRPNGYARIGVEGKQEAEFADQSLNLATAYGLALQGLGEARVEANILPEVIIKQRLWKSKQPWFAGAAALIAVAVGLVWAGFFQTRSAYEAEHEQVRQYTDQTIKRAQQLVTDWNNAQTEAKDPRQRIENIRRILDYRDVWPKLMVDINQAIAAVGPQPELLEPDYGKIESIFRTQRRRVYIDSIEVEYLSDIGAGDYQKQWEQLTRQRMMNPDAANVAPTAGPMAPGRTNTEVSNQQRPPTFVVEIHGTTPVANAATFLSDGFVGWMKKHAEQADRPYRIVQTDQALLSIRPVSVSNVPSLDGRPGAGRPPLEGRAAARGARGTPVAPTQPTQTVKLDDNIYSLLPTRPLEEEDRSNDQQFHIRWMIELIRPEDARQAEEGDANRSARSSEVTP